MRRLWVVSYDVSDDSRRTQLVRYLEGWGWRVLESVFECVWRADQIPQVRLELQAIIDPQADQLWLVPVCQRCLRSAEVDGQHRKIGQVHYHVV
jgi:CRISPR-associated protein Cas2